MLRLTVMGSTRVTAQFVNAGRVPRAAFSRSGRRQRSVLPPRRVAARRAGFGCAPIRAAAVCSWSQEYRRLELRRVPRRVFAGSTRVLRVGCRSGEGASRSDQRYARFGHMALDLAQPLHLACPAPAVFLSADHDVSLAARPRRRINRRMSLRRSCLVIAAASVQRGYQRSNAAHACRGEVTHAGFAGCGRGPLGDDAESPKTV